MVKFAAPDGTHDTRDMFDEQTVSYGSKIFIEDFKLNSGNRIYFTENKLLNITQVDERNLNKCRFLNL